LAVAALALGVNPAPGRHAIHSGNEKVWRRPPTHGGVQQQQQQWTV
jgi:hypothetical protein